MRIGLIDRSLQWQKNWLINGRMDYAQRNTGTVALAAAGTMAYQTLDRWMVGHVGGTTSPVSLRSLDSPGIWSPYSLGIGGTAVNVTDIWRIRQRIESINARNLVNQIVSMGVTYTSNGPTRARLILRHATVVDNFTSTVEIYNQVATITNDSTWQNCKWEGISLTGNVEYGLEVELQFDQNTSLSVTTAVRVTDAMLNLGPISTSFSYFGEDLAAELRACQRYYCKSFSPDISVGSATTGSVDTSWRAVDTVYARGNARFPVLMRIEPTIVTYNHGNQAYGITLIGTGDITGTTIANKSISGFNLIYKNGGMVNNGMYSLNWISDAEL